MHQVPALAQRREATEMKRRASFLKHVCPRCRSRYRDVEALVLHLRFCPPERPVDASEKTGAV